MGLKIITISDTHSKHHQMTYDVGDGDIIICAGDVTGRGSRSDMEDFVQWYSNLPHKHKVLIAGNHDWIAEKDPKWVEDLCAREGITYLNDSGCEIEGIKIWGSPVQPEFCNWAFNRSRTIEDSMSMTAQYKNHPYIGNHWDLIPEDIDILITHGPPMGVLDETCYSPEHVGCKVLKQHIDRIRPKMHVFGHIHEGRGVLIDYYKDKPITYVNASMVTRSYNFHGECFVFDWEDVLKGNSYGD